MLEGIASILGYLMNFIYSIVQNYGLAIILFTFLVKLIILPFSIKQQKSLEKAQEIQPLMQELQRKYGNNQQKFAEEYQKLLKEKNMSYSSSMGCSGCLLSLIQIPILLGMFYMMVSPLTHIMKMDQDTILAYKDEINNQRMQAAILEIQSNTNSGDAEINKLVEEAKSKSYISERYYEIDIINEKGLMDMEFLGVNLCDVAMQNRENKYLLIIPILSTVCTYLSLAINTIINKRKGIKQPKLEDSEIPMPNMTLMNIMMPLMMGYVAYSVPQGVGLYWATSNLLGALQILLIRLVFDSNKEVKTLEAGKKNVENKKSDIIEVDYEKVEDEEEKEVENKNENNDKKDIDLDARSDKNLQQNKTSNNYNKNSSKKKGKKKKKK